jgi:hypothetical protein
MRDGEIASSGTGWRRVGDVLEGEACAVGDCESGEGERGNMEVEGRHVWTCGWCACGALWCATCCV